MIAKKSPELPKVQGDELAQGEEVGSMGSFKLTAETAQLLADIGFLAVRRNRLNAAVLIFDALRRFRPNADYPVIGLALAAMSRGANDAALTLLDTALAERPESSELLAFRGLALFLSEQREQSREVCVDVLKKQADAQVVNLANTLCEEIDRGVSPLHPGWHKNIVL
ncbi:MAG: hypothetical protein V4623_08980 [Pseudomonadota bacterium]